MSTPPPWPPPPPPLPSPPPMAPGAGPGAPAYAPYYEPVPQPKKSPAVPIVAILIAVTLGIPFMVGLIAAIAIPSFLRARMSANEASAISTLRTVVSAEVTWSQTHDGRYAQPACLAAPANCADAQAQSLLTKDIAALGSRNGYAFGFVLKTADDETASEPATADATAQTTAEPGVSPPGAPTDAEVQAQLEQFSTPDTGATAPSTATSAPPQERAAAAPVDSGGFVLWAAPSSPGSSGVRAFCVDETGEIRAYDVDAGWTAPAMDRPRCPQTGTPLR